MNVKDGANTCNRYFLSIGGIAANSVEFEELCRELHFYLKEFLFQITKPNPYECTTRIFEIFENDYTIVNLMDFSYGFDLDVYFFLQLNCTAINNSKFKHKFEEVLQDLDLDWYI